MSWRLRKLLRLHFGSVKKSCRQGQRYLLQLMYDAAEAPSLGSGSSPCADEFSWRFWFLSEGSDATPETGALLWLRVAKSRNIYSQGRSRFSARSSDCIASSQVCSCAHPRSGTRSSQYSPASPAAPDYNLFGAVVAVNNIQCYITYFNS